MSDSNPAGGWSNLDEAMGLSRIQPPKGDSKRDKWIRWIEAIDKDVKGMAINRMAWNGMNDIWQKRQPPLPGSFVFAYLFHTYSHTQSSAIRRQIDERNDVISLARLLSDIRYNPQRFSKEFYIGRFNWGMQHVGHDEYKRLDPAQQGYIDPAIPQKDLENLKKAADKTRNWVNKHVAHLSDKPATDIPSLDELDKALDMVSNVFLRWYTLLTGRGMIQVEPVPQYDWAKPFRMAWILD